MTPALLRIRGWALLQQGSIKDTDTSFTDALLAAREREDIFAAALALDGLVAIGRLRGDAMTSLETERLAALETLGVEAAPLFPEP